MKIKKYLFNLFFIFVVALFLPGKVYALSENEIASRAVCGDFELAIANSNGSLTNVACYNDYNSTYSAMYATNNDDLVILRRQNGNTVLIDAKYAIANLSKNSDGDTINLYRESDGYAWTYITAGTSYYSNDAAFMGINSNTNTARVMIGGFDGLVNKIDGNLRAYQVIPLSWIKTGINYYLVDNSNIYHTLVNIETGSKTTYAIGPKPSMLNNGTYYSYDGNYFYTDIKTMLNDYRNRNRNNSVNAKNPYYNYYQYLPAHTKTTYSVSEIDNYINGRYSGTSSYLYGLGYSYYFAQENYGFNALINISMAIQESNGTSAIARDKFNLFGHNAYDSSASSSSSRYAMPEESVYNNAYSYMLYGYSFPSDSRFFGSQLGNKQNGANVKYSSDPYWGEQIASHMYSMDKALGLQDYNYYSLAIKNSDATIYPNQQANQSNKISITDRNDNTYSYAKHGTVITILDTITGSDGNKYYKIQSDSNLDANGNYIPKGTSRNYYNWDYNYVYVPVSFYNTISSGGYTTSDITSYVEANYKYEYFQKSSSEINLKAAHLNKDATLYNSPSMVTVNTSLRNGQYVMVYGAALDENGVLKAYLVSSNYSNAQRAWISPSDLTFVSGTYGRIMIHSAVTSNTRVNVRNSPNGTVISTIFEGNFFAIFDTKQINGSTWYNISYDGGSGWVIVDNEQYVNLYTINSENISYNNAPVITVNDKSLVIGESFDYMSGVSAIDKEDGDITKKVTYTNTVDTSKAGSYKVTYSVTDNGGLSTSKMITVTVSERSEMEGIFNLYYLKESNNELILQGYQTIQGMNNTLNEDIKYKVTFENIDTGKIVTMDANRLVSDIPKSIFSLDGYDYNYSWFNLTIDVDDLDLGNYKMYVEASCGARYSKSLISNKIYAKQATKVVSNSHSAIINNNYDSKNVFIELKVRNSILASKTSSYIYNQFDKYTAVEFKDNKLHLAGNTYSYGMDLSSSASVVRNVIFENQSDYSTYKFNLGSITTGSYKVFLPEDDNLDKTRAWYDNNIDISELPVGKYTIYITTQSNIIDIMEFTEKLSRTLDDVKANINGKDYSFSINYSRGNRIELTVK